MFLRTKEPDLFIYAGIWAPWDASTANLENMLQASRYYFVFGQMILRSDHPLNGYKSLRVWSV